MHLPFALHISRTSMRLPDSIIFDLRMKCLISYIEYVLKMISAKKDRGERWQMEPSADGVRFSSLQVSLVTSEANACADYVAQEARKRMCLDSWAVASSSSYRDLVERDLCAVTVDAVNVDTVKS